MQVTGKRQDNAMKHCHTRRRNQNIQSCWLRREQEKWEDMGKEKGFDDNLPQTEDIDWKRQRFKELCLVPTQAGSASH